MYYCQLQQILLATSVNVVLMPDDGPQDQNMWHLLMKLIKFVVVDINRYVALDMLYHSGMNYKKSPQRFYFNPSIIHVESVLDRVALG